MEPRSDNYCNEDCCFHFLSCMNTSMRHFEIFVIRIFNKFRRRQYFKINTFVGVSGGNERLLNNKVHQGCNVSNQELKI